MKTQIITKQISKALLLAMVIALAAPTVNAQRRSSSTIQKSQETDQKGNRPSQRSSDQKKDIYKSTVKNQPEVYREKKQGHNQSAHHNEKHNYKGENRWDKKHYDNNAHVQVHIIPPAYSYRNVYVTHHQPISFRRIPRKAIWIPIDGENYLVYKNRFYRPGPAGFYRVKAPRYAHQLPEGCNLVWMKGQKFYNFHGVLFIDTPVGFKIIAS